MRDAPGDGGKPGSGQSEPGHAESGGLAPDVFAGCLIEHHPDYPGWHDWRLGEEGGYNRAVLGTVLVRREDNATVRTRIFPQAHHLNQSGHVHGGITLGFVDVSMFAGAALITGLPMQQGVTIEVSCQFTGAGHSARPLDAVVRLIRETGRMGFAQGQVVQGEDVIAGFSGILRKPR